MIMTKKILSTPHTRENIEKFVDRLLTHIHNQPTIRLKIR